ncbi:PHP domain-containing protein [Microbacterium invictum]|uniref:PHP domain-containing protein n=1 Tax=Microbacterium invictum TaxID=515415 RepID=A0ABZ0VEK4_9MICO|nr:PHP domain-containing protein [Microbacterium invictum]WQB71811.1 PHP domain-containing protein [Microbacterium invictum]
MHSSPGPQGPGDLHLHSVYSDGTETPAEVMAAAGRHGMRTAALTDHDTTAGWREAADAATRLGLTFLPGMELSAKHQWRSVHILAYLFDPEDERLRALTDRIRSSRMDRAQEMAERISADFDLGWSDILAQTTDGATVGRPHIADALIARGYVRDRTEAFSRILHPGGDYYVALYAPDPVTAVERITRAGGVAVVAHPAGRGMLPHGVMQQMIDAGLAGLELRHRENIPDQVRQLRRVVEERDLIVTGSSDYHGQGKPNVPGENSTDTAMIERIIDLGRGSSPVLA